MNHTEITGYIAYPPDFIEGNPRLIRLRLHSVDKNATPTMYTDLKCQWIDPPEKYWKSDKMVRGTLIQAAGKLYTSSSRKADAQENRSIYLHILYFKIKTTQEEFEQMKKRAVERACKSGGSDVYKKD